MSQSFIFSSSPQKGNWGVEFKYSFAYRHVIEQFSGGDQLQTGNLIIVLNKQAVCRHIKERTMKSWTILTKYFPPFLSFF